MPAINFPDSPTIGQIYTDAGISWVYSGASVWDVVTGSYQGTFTGSLLGTASWAFNALTASRSSTASFSSTASYSLTAVTASSVATASWAINAITASYALTSSIAQINQSQYRFELVTTIDQDIWLYPATITRVVKSPGVFSAQYRTGSAEAFNSISFTGNESTTPIAVKANDEFSWRIVYSSGYTTAALTVVSQRT